MQRSMEYICPVLYEQGRTANHYPYDIVLSPLHGDNYYHVNQAAPALPEDEPFCIEGDHVLLQPGSSILECWEIKISGSLNPDFEQKLVYALERVATIPIPIQDSLVSSINGLIRGRPFALTHAFFEGHALINLYLDEYEEEEEEDDDDDEEEEEEEDEGEEEDEEEEDEGEEEEEEEEEDEDIDRALIRGFVVLELDTVKIEGKMKEDRCAICLEDFIADSMAAKLYCSHIFHDDCVRQWLVNRGTCPMCRSLLSVSNLT